MSKRPWITIEEAFDEEYQFIKNRVEGKEKSLSTGFRRMDNIYFKGWMWGWIVTIAGMSGTGKTAFLNLLESNFFRHNPHEDFEVLNFNFEMRAARLVGRKISEDLGRTLKQIYNASVQGNLKKSELAKIKKLKSNYKQRPIYYVEEAMSAKSIAESIEAFIYQKGLEDRDRGLIVTIDHALLVQGTHSREGERQVLTQLTQTLNNLKKKYKKVLFIIVSQLNRKIEREERTRPNNYAGHYPRRGDIFGSEALYQYSDAVIIIHRPEMLNIGQYGPKKIETKDRVFLHHLKNRDSEVGITIYENLLHHNKIKETSL